MKDYLTHILKYDNSSGDTNERVDHWLNSFEKSHKKYIIMHSLSLNYLFLEDCFFVTVRSPPGFINQENKKELFKCNVAALIFQ